ncbi:MAG: substrate-binding domain-containing protein [Deltaproteobacteria bacterium]|nr:substrate-binding domain-containing protein [Deltaproteobacteria bacterium]
MRKSVYAFKIMTVFIFSLTIISVSTAYSTKIVRVSVSSPVAQAYGKEILLKYETMTGFNAQTYVGPSQVAINRLVNGVCDIAATEQQVSYDMKANGYVEIPFCRDALAIITNKQFSPTEPCHIDNLSIKQLRAIFGGSINNWKELGGPDQEIILIVPGKDTGAFQNFKDQVMRFKEMRYDFITYHATKTIKGIKHMPGAISFVAQGAIAENKEIKIIKVDGLSPKDKDYSLYQTFFFLTKGEPKGPAKAVINFGLSKWGIEIMRSKGMSPILKAAP